MYISKQKIKNIFLEKDSQANIHYLDRYIRAIYAMPKSDNIERHHILPVSIFPEYKLEIGNIVSAPTRWHYVLHWMLIKIFSDIDLVYKMSFAFNCMKRVIKDPRKKGILYEQSRKYISAAISQSNKGKIRSDEFKKAVSTRTLGTMVVKNSQGNKFRASKTSPECLSGDWVFYRVGYRHPENVIKKMKRNSGIKGKIPCHDNEYKVKYFYAEDIPLGWFKGNPAHVGVKRDQIACDKMKKNWEGRKKIACPFCGIESKNMANLRRYHFENCKHKEKNE